MNDMTKGAPLEKIMRFSLPLIVGNLFQLLYNMVDTFIVGRTMGLDALAGLGIAGSLSFFVVGFAMGFTGGTAIPLAQAFGAKDYRKVKRSVVLNILLSVVVSVALTMISTVSLWKLLEIMNTPPEVIQYAYDYMLVIFAGMIVTVIFNMVSNLLRSIGDSRTPVVALVVTTIANIILDYVFIVYFHMGVAGAAYATILSQALAVGLCFWVIYQDVYVLQVEKKDIVFVRKEIIQHCRLGFPMAFQTSIIAVGAVSVTTALNTLGADAVAGYSAAYKIDQLVIQVLMSFGIAMATYVGQNYGASEYGRIIQGVRQTAFLSVTMAIIFAMILMFMGGTLTALFGDSNAGTTLATYGRQFFLLTGPFYWLLSLLFVFRSTLQGLNESLVPTFAGLMELVMRVVAAFVLTPIIGFSGTVISNPMAWLGAIVILVPAYIRKRKELIQLEKEKTMIVN
ncbi:MATE family efflux transporter [Facklamia sp. DSM 111019]|nr:MATE family efflux transporter [Facklamia lactis]